MSQTKPTSSEPTEIAGRYQVVKKLGAGAFGTVYKAKDKILGRMVAIKTIRLEGLAAAGASLDELMDRFKREAQVSAQLKHPNIVTIYDIGDSDGISYLAMEFIDGVGLDRVISTAGRLTLDRAAALGVQIADALDFAHKHSVVHRDIKPANIMVEAGDRVKVTDFGIAKVTNSGDHLTMTGSLLGTPSYMSPEQARGAALDGRSDLFAVGCILYEMLAGQKAFRGDSITGLIFKIITEEPQPLQALDPTVPEEMIRIIARALAKTPEARYQSGRELADDLSALSRPGATPTLRQAEMPTVPGGPPTAPGAAPTINVPSATMAGGPATRVSAPPAAPTVHSAPPPPPPMAGARPAPRKSGSGLGLLLGLAAVGLIFVGGAAVGGWWFFLRGKTKPGTDIAQQATDGGSTAPSLPPVTQAEAPPTTLAAQTQTPDEPPQTQPPATQVARNVPPATVERPVRNTRPPDEAPPPPFSGGSGGGNAYLDEEPEEASGGRGVPQGYQKGGGYSGVGARMRMREKSPHDLVPVERPAVAALRHVINAEDIYKRKHGRYGNFSEMMAAQSMYLDVPIQARNFQRKGYKFELTLEEDGFKVLAIPTSIGGRSFEGDETGFIREPD